MTRASQGITPSIIEYEINVEPPKERYRSDSGRENGFYDPVPLKEKVLVYYQ
jgi:hypothetical protein